MSPLPNLISIAFAALREEMAHVLTLVEYRSQGFVITRRGQPCAILLPLDAAEKLGLKLDDLEEFKGK